MLSSLGGGERAIKRLTVAKRRDCALKVPERGAVCRQLSILNADSGAVYRPDGCKTVEWGGAFTQAGTT